MGPIGTAFCSLYVTLSGDSPPILRLVKTVCVTSSKTPASLLHSVFVQLNNHEHPGLTYPLHEQRSTDSTSQPGSWDLNLPLSPCLSCPITVITIVQRLFFVLSFTPHVLVGQQPPTDLMFCSTTSLPSYQE